MSDGPQANVVATTDATFQADVFERSRTIPVVVDFWADWCQPCLLLAPLLEQRAAAADGRWVLIKAKTDDNPTSASQFNVQGIPAVYAVVDGEIVDFFNGVLSEGQLDQWLGNVANAGDMLTLRSLQATDPVAAAAKYRELITESPNVPELQVGLLQCLFEQQDLDSCREQLEQMETRGFLEPEAQKIKAELSLAGNADVDIDALRKNVADKADDYAAKLELGAALAAQQTFEEALITLLGIVQDDRHGRGDDARAKMVEIFQVLPDDSELISVYRRKLASALY